MTRLIYKVAIVTNATQDLGFAAAQALASEGATILLTDTNDEAGEAKAAALRAQSLKAEYHHLDAADPLSWAALVDRTMRTHGHLDILVNQHGANISITIEDATAPQLREILEQNLTAPFLGMKAVIPAMRQSGGGAIINIAANVIAELLPLYALYSAAKSGLVSLTKSTAMHCLQRGYGITVNAIHPGTHESELLLTNALRSTTAPNLHTLLHNLPAGQDAAEQDFATAIIRLASDDARAITGTEIFCAGPLTPAALKLPR